MVRTSAQDRVYQLKVTLVKSKPPIWRRLLITGDTTLFELSGIILTAMEWSGYHMHRFIIGGTYYGRLDPDYGEEYIKDEKRYTLAQVAPTKKAKFRYEYDFGDNWQHDVLVEQIVPREQDAFYPYCITGRRACPPEDCGGVWGYEDLLEVLADPDSPDYEEMWEWVGDDFDPAAFDVDNVNALLAHWQAQQEKKPAPYG